ncbi:MAG: hypothetical protein EZS28_002311 [Streblomastix strix]|uniref:Uncharacterized protein n=1 Tax=Streblomastix strix TaxID=222440 RepID=A0A5J4X5Q0_9EUKA|nr:MAG: hypothetical protein EZS28_002311 [Streblomastix strix]
MQVGKIKIKVYEDKKKSASALTQSQQNKLLLKTRGGGIEKKKIQKPIEEEEEAMEYDNETEGSQSQSEVTKKLLKKQLECEQLNVQVPHKLIIQTWDDNVVQRCWGIDEKTVMIGALAVYMEEVRISFKNN